MRNQEMYNSTEEGCIWAVNCNQFYANFMPVPILYFFCNVHDSKITV